MVKLNFLGAVALLVVAEAVALSSDIQAVCSTLHSKYPKLLVWDPIGPKGLETVLHASTYNEVLFDYWNAASSGNRPSCGFFPSNAEEVSYAVQTLNSYPSVQFALKSGGHSPNLGFSSVKGGVLIAFRPNSKYANPSPDGKSVEVGAGCKWIDVYSALEPLGKAAVGGRQADVGVIGLLLGGGLSYLSSQYGLPCDNVISFECVLANGTIVTATKDSNTDLFYALRGGGNQYAIVTKVVLKTYDIGNHATVWGGVRTYGGDKHEELLSAITKFAGNYKDPKAAIIPTFEFVSGVGIGAPFTVVFFFYDGEKPPAGVFDDFDAIFSLSDDTKAKKYTAVTKEFLGGNYKGLRFAIRENTFPNMPLSDMKSFLKDQYDMLSKSSTEGAWRDLIDVKLLSFAIQPMSKVIAQASRDASKDAGGDNTLGLDPSYGDRVFVEYDFAWLSPLCDKKCPQFFEKKVQAIHDLHKEKYSGIAPTNYESGDLDYLSYNPIFMNDAMFDQDVLQSYGNETYNKLKSIHESYDPKGFFADRQNGFKFTT